ncbi:uncharacterized protein LOC114321581 [Camellia sinensis]|uniref:uncharacterized protein LOC114321581 n=1 Tax=Camellia sinensis TaxID=4442 RepID=UPI00103638A3|nr:uncharacterized protein LOC114321581 [Camellia sinensis]
MEANHKATKGYLALNDQDPLPNLFIPSMDMLIWNCRGAGNQRLKRTMRKLVQIHKPDILILMKTKVEFKSMGMLFNCIGFTASAHVDPTGRSGGIWMLRNPNVVTVRVVEASSQLITATISRQDFPDWLLSAVYASPNHCKWDEFWEHLEVLSRNMTELWLVVGDFNDLSTTQEKRSFNGNHHLNQSQDQRRSKKFNNKMHHCNLMDLGCSGPRLT